MPLYHFNLINDSYIRDDEGQEFPNFAAAQDEAVRSARDVMAEHVRVGREINLNHGIEITDEDQKPLQTLHFNEVVRIVR